MPNNKYKCSNCKYYSKRTFNTGWCSAWNTMKARNNFSTKFKMRE